MTSGKLGSNKNSSLKIFGASEMEKTPANCIPRLCTLTVSKLILTKPINVDLSSIFLVIKMANSRRTIRSSEINLNSKQDLLNENQTQNKTSTKQVNVSLDTVNDLNTGNQLNTVLKYSIAQNNSVNIIPTNSEISKSSLQSPTSSLSQPSTAILCALSPQQQFQQHLEALQLHTIELDTRIIFKFQYPHFLKKGSNQLQIMIQRRKYKNQAILGFKTLAIGHINLAQLFNNSLDLNLTTNNSTHPESNNQSVSAVNTSKGTLSYSEQELNIKLRCSQTKPQNMHKSQLLMANVVIKDIFLEELMKPDLTVNQNKRQKSLEKTTVVPESEDENDDFNWNDDNSDTDLPDTITNNIISSQPESTNSAKQKLNKWRKQINNRSRKGRKLFFPLDKLNQNNEEQQRNLKQRLISILRKFRIPDSVSFESPEQYEAAIERQLLAVNAVDNVDVDNVDNVDERDIEDLLAAGVDLDDQDLDDLSDYSAHEFDDCVSISSTPKPSLRPFFSSCTLVGSDADDDLKNYAKQNLEEEEEDDGEEGDEVDEVDEGDEDEDEEVVDTVNTNFKANFKKSKLFTKTTNYMLMKDRKALTALMNLLAKHKNRNLLPKECDNSPTKCLIEQLKKVFSSEIDTIPKYISLIQLVEELSFINNLNEKLSSELNHTVIKTCTLMDMKATFSYLINRIQMFCNCNSRTPSTIKICIFGSDAYLNTVLRAYVECMSNKAPEWQSYLRFYPIPLYNVGSTTFSNYLGSLDQQYNSYFCSGKWKEFFDSSLSSNLNDLVNLVKTYLTNSNLTIQIPVAEAMIMYKTRFSNTCIQVFIPFINDVKIGITEKNLKSGNISSIDEQEQPQQLSSSPTNKNDLPTHSNLILTNISSNLNNEKEGNSVINNAQQSPPNSPAANASNLQLFSSTTVTTTNSNITASNITNVSNVNNGLNSIPNECKLSKESSNRELDLQIDYWVKDYLCFNKKNEFNLKTTLKNTFKSLQVSRFQSLQENVFQPSVSLTLNYLIREKKQKIMRLGKKKEKEFENKNQIVDGIHRLVCSCKNSSFKVNVDGIDWTGVKFFQLTAQWQTHVKNFPIALFNVAKK